MRFLPPPGISPSDRTRVRALLSRVPVLGLGCALAFAGCEREAPEAAYDRFLAGGLVVDGGGSAPVRADVAIRDGRIAAVGTLPEEATAAEVLDVAGLTLARGLIDMHSHAEMEGPWGRDARPVLAPGITTVVMGGDGGGTWTVGERLQGWVRDAPGVNALAFVGHDAIRQEVLGMEGGGLVLSTGLFDTPSSHATTEEVIALARVAAEWDGAIFDTHDRDLGAMHRGIGYDASVAEGIPIGEESDLRVIVSPVHPQGAHNYGRAEVGARMIEEARARGVEVWAAQHPDTATESYLRAYALPRWASAGADEAMARRFADPDTMALLRVQMMESLAMRGGPEKILFGDPDPRLDGKTGAGVAAGWSVEVPDAVRRIVEENGNATVMNLDLYDEANPRDLATKPPMMTSTDGRTPAEGGRVVHPRVYGAFPRKLREMALDDGLPEFPCAIRSVTGLAADFLRLHDRGYLRPGMRADVVALDRDRVRDRVTSEDPHRFSEGAVHVLVNGTLVVRDEDFTGAMAGQALRADGTAVAAPGAARDEAGVAAPAPAPGSWSTR